MIKEDNFVCDEVKYKYFFSILLMLRVIFFIFFWKKGVEIEKLCENQYGKFKVFFYMKVGILG